MYKSQINKIQVKFAFIVVAIRRQRGQWQEQKDNMTKIILEN